MLHKLDAELKNILSIKFTMMLKYFSPHNLVQSANLMKYFIGILLLLLFLTTHADNPRVTLRHLTGSIYLVEDTDYDKTNSVVYIGPASVTVVGATWTPETALLLANEIRKVTDKPIAVHGPELMDEYLQMLKDYTMKSK